MSVCHQCTPVYTASVHTVYTKFEFEFDLGLLIVFTAHHSSNIRNCNEWKRDSHFQYNLSHKMWFELITSSPRETFSSMLFMVADCYRISYLGIWKWTSCINISNLFLFQIKIHEPEGRLLLIWCPGGGEALPQEKKISKGLPRIFFFAAPSPIFYFTFIFAVDPSNHFYVWFPFRPLRISNGIARMGDLRKKCLKTWHKASLFFYLP